MKKAIITVCVGELYWELARFVPYIIWRKKQEDFDLIVITRKERYDLYGDYATKFIPLEIKGDGIEKKAECFRLIGFSKHEYLELLDCNLEDYDKIEKIYPDYNRYANLNQFDRTKYDYNYKPRKENRDFVNTLNIQKPIIIIAPRFREGFARNWIYWKEFYDSLYNSELKNKYEFILCGKNPDYISDERFLDINSFKYNGSSMGITIELIKKAELVVGSLSAIPNLSLLLKTPVLQWGHAKRIFTSDEYNPFHTKNIYLEDSKYNIKTSIIISELQKCLMT